MPSCLGSCWSGSSSIREPGHVPWILANSLFWKNPSVALWMLYRQHLKGPVFAMWNMQVFGIQYELTMTGQSRTTTSRRKELCTWNCVCVVKSSWRTKSSCWTVRRPTPMTTWKPRSTRSTWNPTMTWHTWWTREWARVVISLRCLALSHSFLAHIAWLKWSACLCHLIHAWSERFLWPFIFLLSFLINLKQFLLPFNFLEDK